MWKIPLSDVRLGTAEIDAVEAVLKGGWLSMGAVSAEFEKDFSDFTGANFCFAVTNATAALHLACEALGVGPGDEVIVPSLTFVATANAVLYTGATPVFADITSEADLTISAAAIEAAVTPRTKAIIVMHYAGYPCDMPAICALAEKHQLFIIEDAAHAAGSYLHGKHLGTLGDVGCFSFFANKNMSTAEGGMVTTNNAALAEKIKLLRSHGMTTLTWDRHRGHAWSYDVAAIGYNYRIDEIRAALGRVQLASLSERNQKRKQLTNHYFRLLKDSEIGIPFMEHPGLSACHILPIVLPKNSDRTRFMENMKQLGVQTSIHYPPVHLFSAYEPLRATAKLPLTEDIARREVTLPLYPTLTESQVEYVVASVRESFASSLTAK